MQTAASAMTRTIEGFASRRSVVGLAIIAASFGGIAAWPARAEDSGFWDTIRAMSRGGHSFAPAPSEPSWFPRPSFRRAAPKRAAPPEVARLPVPEIKPQDPSKRPNPLVTLLSDPTLRKGDIVMFPDGPRVFRGDPGARHASADFIPASRDKDMNASTRKLVAALPVGQNNAWSSTAAKAKGQLAQGDPDVETTGSLGKARARR